MCASCGVRSHSWNVQGSSASLTGNETAIIGVNGDDVGDDNTTSASLEVTRGQTVSEAIDHAGDQDWFKVSLKAGQSYDFILTPDTGGPNGGPDLKLGIYRADGTLIEEYDSAGFGGVEKADFLAPADGIYYVAVTQYTPADTGAYTLKGSINGDGPPANSGTPLDSIDWGGTANRVDTDGVKTADGRDVIHVYFAKASDGPYMSDLGPVQPTDWEQYAKDGVYTAFTVYEAVINVKYEEVATKEEADFVLIANVTAPVLLGRMSPPNESYEGQGEFNTAGVGWTEEGLKQGGYGYVTFIHEFGHGHGLAHPHDTGGGSSVMNGVESDSDPGDFNLNQGVFTTMSYRSGNPDGANGGSDSDNYGYEGTLSPFDIAVLQQKYGANTAHNSGNDTYTLKDVNASGTFYAAIWDTGGSDTINYVGQRDTVIDLRAATLRYEEGGGGRVSYAAGIHGGFTIANGVIIENATGGDGDDVLTGNDAANTLLGAAGHDILLGGAGNDVLDGGAGFSDVADFRDKTETIYLTLNGSGTSRATIGGVVEDTLRNIEWVYGGSAGDSLRGDAGANLLAGEGGNDVLRGGGGRDRLNGGAGSDLVDYRDKTESIEVTLRGATPVDVLVGGKAEDIIREIERVHGGSGADILTGDSKSNTFTGFLGADVLRGGGGADRFAFENVTDSTVAASGRDRILDFSRAQGDRINLDRIDAITGGADDAFQFVSAFTNVAGQLISTANGAREWLVQGDVDGDGLADFAISVVSAAALTASDFLL